MIFIPHQSKSQSYRTNFCELNQTSTYTIFRSSFSDRIFFSSNDGLNVFDGVSTQLITYRENIACGRNIQGNIAEDSIGRVWFTTYEALHYWDQKTNTVSCISLTNPAGDTLIANYRLIQLSGNTLWLKAGNRLVSYDIHHFERTGFWDLDLTDQHSFTLTYADDNFHFFSGGPYHCAVYRLLPQGSYEQRYTVSLGIRSILEEEKKLWWGGVNGKVYVFDFTTLTLTDSLPVSDRSIIGFAKQEQSILLVSDGRNSIKSIHTKSLTMESNFNLVSTDNCVEATALLHPYIDPRGNFWVGSGSQGVFYFSFANQRFNHWLEGVDVTSVLNGSSRDFFILTRRNGIYHVDSNGKVLFHWDRSPVDKLVFPARQGVWLDQNQLLFLSGHNTLFSLDPVSRKISSVPIISKAPVSFIEQIEQLSNGRIVMTMQGRELYEVVVTGKSISLVPYFDAHPGAKQLLNFKQDAKANLYISNDEVDILMYEPDHVTRRHHYRRTIPIPGGIRSITDIPGDSSFYLTNANGLWKINKNDFSFVHIIDPKEHLLQTIYTSLPDSSGRIWLGTNTGLMTYHPGTGQVMPYTLLDGIQGLEYNTHAARLLPDGKMVFGGINGLNYFDPDRIFPSTQNAPVYVSHLMINDEPDPTLQYHPNYTDNLSLEYHRNTISFRFHAIDYSDPAATRVKYQLTGFDTEYLETDQTQGFVRYANLPPGKYTLSLLGSNADGVWNTEPREIHITIHPPFWKTWWFISLTAMLILSSLYLIVRAYYRRKLEKKNQQLREQALVIEKQHAVERERSRIASEMHDDLGAGLTTIRYLSDKALHHAKDTEEKDQIQRIADHSNRLVRNMSEIIWAMNSRFDYAEDLIGYLRRYASEYFDEHQIRVAFSAPEDVPEAIPISGEKRRNLFLVFKEVCHNTIKYAQASHVSIDVQVSDHFKIQVTEHGAIGFDPETAMDHGNGLYNSQSRMKMILGAIRYEKTPDAMHIFISVPLSPPHGNT